MRARNSKESKEKDEDSRNWGFGVRRQPVGVWQRPARPQCWHPPLIQPGFAGCQGGIDQRSFSPGLLFLPASPCLHVPQEAECCGHCYFSFIKETAFPSWRRFVQSSIAGMLYASPSSCFVLLPPCSFPGKVNFPYGLSLDGSISPQWIW